MEIEGIRLNKYLSEAGICSRRRADEWVAAGRIAVDGKPAVIGQKVLPGQKVAVDGKLIGGEADGQQSVEGSMGDQHKASPILLAVNKPCGIVCTTSDKDRAPNIVDMVNYPLRVYPVGRLDKDSEGLILLTNQGDLVNKMMRSGNAHEKEYIVTIDQPVTEEFLQRMRSGVPIRIKESPLRGAQGNSKESPLRAAQGNSKESNSTVTRPCRAEKTGKYSFRIILTQGLNRQIRRMCEYLGCHVRTLKRIRIMNIELGDLKEGCYRLVTGCELEKLFMALSGSINLTYKEMVSGEAGEIVE